ncbi:MAG: alpha-hydroxy-acid oxidizing protein [Candidatus Hodarchaeales archaeon]|jgi:isopentenyl diphosphate isomerase/L-lactate dehydrogenase-like FMN-dependent dehydrogenase
MNSNPLSLEDVRERASKKLKAAKVCMVYKDCDGNPNRFCQGQHYGRPLGFGGIGSGKSFHNNWLALRKIKLKMKLMDTHFDPNTTFDFFGKKLTMPIMAASVAGVNSFGGESVISERDFCRAVVNGCGEAGTIGWRGDTYTYSLEKSYGIDAIAEGNYGGVKIVKPREQSVIKAFFEKAEKAKVDAVGVDTDGAGSYAMRTHNKPVYRKTQQDINDLVESTNLPVIVKGVMCEEDAYKAMEAGASGIVVSNHGGRVLDHTPGTADVLPEIAMEMESFDVMVVVDGGVRTGYDVLKMLALGADAVLIGRDIVRAAVGAGAEGVRIQMDFLRKTLAKAMLMTGCKNLSDITRDIIDPSSEII